MAKAKEIKKRKGYTLLGFTALAVATTGAVGLSIDVGNLHWHRTRIQTAADSAAMAGILELKRGSTSTIVSAAQNDSRLNGFENSVANTTVTVNNPPVYGSYAGDANAVEAIVRRTVPTMFMSLLARDSVQVTARAVGKTSSAGGASACIYALNKTISRGFSIGGSNATYLSCSAIVESSSGSGFSMEGSGTLYMRNTATVGVVGGYNLTGQTSVRRYPGNTLIPPSTGITDPDDPFSTATVPTSTTVRSMSPVNYDGNSPPSGNTIQPGVYCGGMRIGNTHGSTYTFAPGVYIMAGGGFLFNSQARITGTGVTIYNTSGANSGISGCTQAFQPFTIDGQANVTLTAPTSGSYKAMLIFQDRNISDERENKIVGGASTNLVGTIYLKKGDLTFSGNNTSTGYTVLVADTIKINGNSDINNNYSSLTGGSPFPTSGTGRTSLVE